MKHARLLVRDTPAIKRIATQNELGTAPSFSPRDLRCHVMSRNHPGDIAFQIETQNCLRATAQPSNN